MTLVLLLFLLSLVCVSGASTSVVATTPTNMTMKMQHPYYTEDGVCFVNNAKPCRLLSGSIAVTTLFTKHKDMTGPKKDGDYYDYIKSWVESLHLHGMRGLVLYDDLDDDFLLQHTSHNLMFRKFYHYLNRWPNDRRFFMWQRMVEHETNVKFWVFSDGRDVRFQKDVFEFIHNYKPVLVPKIGVLDPLFLGLDHSLIRQHVWMIDAQRMCSRGMWIFGKHRKTTQRRIHGWFAQDGATLSQTDLDRVQQVRSRDVRHVCV
jgi:hypothetical protein